MSATFIITCIMIVFLLTIILTIIWMFVKYWWYPCLDITWEKEVKRIILWYTEYRDGRGVRDFKILLDYDKRRDKKRYSWYRR